MWYQFSCRSLYRAWCISKIYLYQHRCDHHRTYIDEFVIAAEKSRFWIDCIPKIEVLAFNHMGKVIYWNCFCAIFSLLRYMSTFIWFGCYCFLSLCLMSIWILNKIICEKSLFSPKICSDRLSENVPVELGKVLLLKVLLLEWSVVQDALQALVSGRNDRKNHLLSLVFVLKSVSVLQNHKLLRLKNLN